MPYEYQPYPKWIDTTQGRKIVHSEEEHLAHLADESGESSPARNDLIEQAEAAGIKIDGRWSDARLAKEIENAR